MVKIQSDKSFQTLARNNILFQAIHFSCATSLFAVVCFRTTYKEIRDSFAQDLKRSLTCRLEIIEDSIEDNKREDMQTLFSSFELCRRINYPIETIPVSLYEG